MRVSHRRDRVAYLVFHVFGDHALVGVIEGISYRMMVMMDMCELDAGYAAGNALARRALKYSSAKMARIGSPSSMLQVTCE